MLESSQHLERHRQQVFGRRLRKDAYVALDTVAEPLVWTQGRRMVAKDDGLIVIC